MERAQTGEDEVRLGEAGLATCMDMDGLLLCSLFQLDRNRLSSFSTFLMTINMDPLHVILDDICPMEAEDVGG